MTLGKEDPGHWKRKHYIAHFAELALEKALVMADLQSLSLRMLRISLHLHPFYFLTFIKSLCSRKSYSNHITFVLVRVPEGGWRAKVRTSKSRSQTSFPPLTVLLSVTSVWRRYPTPCTSKGSYRGTFLRKSNKIQMYILFLPFRPQN
jgi:hypothetical protein